MEKVRHPAEDKILAFLSRDNFKDAIEFFHRNFSDAAPEKSFLLHVFAELNRIKVYDEVFNLLKAVSKWYGKDPEIVKAEKLAKKNYYYFLIEKANALIASAQDRDRRFQEEAGSLDKLYREKLLVENKNALQNFYNDALNIFNEAHGLRSEGFEALFGIANCHKELGNAEEAKKANYELSQLVHEDSSKAEVEKVILELPDYVEPAESFVRPDHFDLGPLERLFEEKKLEQVLDALEVILKRNDEYVPALLMKARVLTELREFRPAQTCIDQAMKLQAGNKDVHTALSDFLDVKFKVLAKGGVQFLKKGIQLGPSLGRDYFAKSIECFVQALTISPGDVEILDGLYTAYKFQRNEEKAFDVKKQLHLHAPNFKPTFDTFHKVPMCFLATYAYDGDFAALEDFRYIRREWMLPSELGRRCVVAYFRLSPDWVRKARQWNISPSVFRFLLDPLRRLARYLRNRP